jgi:REP element-mobilizing transposase RayT
MQVPRRVDSEIPKKGGIRRTQKTFGHHSKGTGCEKESRILEGHLMLDHIHMLVSIPPKYSVAQVVGFIRGKSGTQIARTFLIGKYLRCGGMSRLLQYEVNALTRNTQG